MGRTSRRETNPGVSGLSLGITHYLAEDLFSIAYFRASITTRTVLDFIPHLRRLERLLLRRYDESWLLPDKLWNQAKRFVLLVCLDQIVFKL